MYKNLKKKTTFREMHADTIENIATVCAAITVFILVAAPMLWLLNIPQLRCLLPAAKIITKFDLCIVSLFVIREVYVLTRNFWASRYPTKFHKISRPRKNTVV